MTIVTFSTADIGGLRPSGDEHPDSSHVVAKFEEVQGRLEDELTNVEWFRDFTWAGSPGSPYIGPPDADESEYVWVGLAHERWRDLGKPSVGLQFEFGVDAGSARGFFDREVICGLYFGPWASDETRETIAGRLEEHGQPLVSFLETHPEYVLATKREIWTEPDLDIFTRRNEDLAKGFALTRNLTLNDLVACDDVAGLVRKSFLETHSLNYALTGQLPPGTTTDRPGNPTRERSTQSGNRPTPTTATAKQDEVDEAESARPSDVTCEPDTSASTDSLEPPVPVNQLSEYYEAIRSVRKVVSTVMQLAGTDIDPDDITHPCVQYYVLLDACIDGGGGFDVNFVGYGQQHRDRLVFTVDDYRRAFGDGTWVTDYGVIDVESYSRETQDWLTEHTFLKDPSRLVRPVGPVSETPLPEMVVSQEGLAYALSVLRQFPAYPALPTERGATDRTVPIEDMYVSLFGHLAPEHRVDIDSVPTFGEEPPNPITGPVPDATPKSRDEVESFLVDFGNLTHLYRRLDAPSESPIQRSLPVFGLDWYRPDSQSFRDLQGLAKYGDDESIPVFRRRVQDMVHRRFLRDSWEYDFITVYPGHEAGSLSPQLVELAQDAVVETSTIYAPLLERTETMERQREKSREERADVAREPEASLRARATLDGENVILFDDICTSGSSLLAGAHTLRQAGAGRVVGLTLGFTAGAERGAIREITKPKTVASEVISGVER